MRKRELQQIESQNNVTENKHFSKLHPFDHSIEELTPSIYNKNQLMHSASKIFSIITQLKLRTNYEDPSKLKPLLIKELETFQVNAEILDFSKEVVTVGRYALTAYLDETIEKTAWGKKSNWHQHKLLQEAQQKSSANERFFILLSKICLHPEKFIDVIELMYTCLHLGFKGKFLNRPLEKERLQKIIDYTYHVIQKQRGEFEKNLSFLPQSATPPQEAKKKVFPSILIFLLLSILMVGGVYSGLIYLIHSLASEVNQQLETPESKNQKWKNQ